MAMYYYATKLSAIACGARCHPREFQKIEPHRDEIRLKSESINKIELKSAKSTPLPNDISENSLLEDNGQIIDDTYNYEDLIYENGNITSGLQDTLIELLMSNNNELVDKEYIFSLLLSSRLFIGPHDLLGQLLALVFDFDHLDRLVVLLSIWAKTFPYDFRDERMMAHIKDIVTRCANTKLDERVSELLSALLSRLTELEKHEEDLRSCQYYSSEGNQIIWSSSTQLAQMICGIEKKLAKHVGPEEFVQCSSGVLNVLSDKQYSKIYDTYTTLTSAIGCSDIKRTCNLESYLQWSVNLRCLIANDILLCHGLTERSKAIERWSSAAQYCLLVGNYNSATVILKSLQSPAILRLKETWSKLLATTQQLNHMQRQAEGCDSLWNSQTRPDDNNIIKSTYGSSSSSPDETSNNLSNKLDVRRVFKSNRISKTKDWVVIPVFSDIVRLALVTRDDCLKKLPNGHINVAAFNRLAAIVAAFTNHVSDVITTTTKTEYEEVYRNIQCCTLLNDRDLMLASFDCEQPTAEEKDFYNIT